MPPRKSKMPKTSKKPATKKSAPKKINSEEDAIWKEWIQRFLLWKLQPSSQVKGSSEELFNFENLIYKEFLETSNVVNLVDSGELQITLLNTLNMPGATSIAFKDSNLNLTIEGSSSSDEDDFDDETKCIYEYGQCSNPPKKNAEACTNSTEPIDPSTWIIEDVSKMFGLKEIMDNIREERQKIPYDHRSQQEIYRSNQFNMWFGSDSASSESNSKTTEELSKTIEEDCQSNNDSWFDWEQETEGFMVLHSPTNMMVSDLKVKRTAIKTVAEKILKPAEVEVQQSGIQTPAEHRLEPEEEVQHSGTQTLAEQRLETGHQSEGESAETQKSINPAVVVPEEEAKKPAETEKDLLKPNEEQAAEEKEETMVIVTQENHMVNAQDTDDVTSIPKVAEDKSEDELALVTQRPAGNLLDPMNYIQRNEEMFNLMMKRMDQMQEQIAKLSASSSTTNYMTSVEHTDPKLPKLLSSVQMTIRKDIHKLSQKVSKIGKTGESTRQLVEVFIDDANKGEEMLTPAARLAARNLREKRLQEKIDEYRRPQMGLALLTEKLEREFEKMKNKKPYSNHGYLEGLHLFLQLKYWDGKLKARRAEDKKKGKNPKPADITDINYSFEEFKLQYMYGLFVTEEGVELNVEEAWNVWKGLNDYICWTKIDTPWLHEFKKQMIAHKSKQRKRKAEEIQAKESQSKNKNQKN